MPPWSARSVFWRGQARSGFDVYASLSAPGVPKPVRLAAMQAIIREETSTSRPR